MKTIKIIEEEDKEIEKLNKKTYEAVGTEVDEVLIDKINELIDVVNELKNKD